MRLASFLLALIAICHYTSDWLGQQYADSVFASRAIFYALGGIERALLYFLVWLLAWGLVSRVALIPLTLACSWGIIESLEMTVCRLGWGLSKALPDVSFAGVCTALTGIPMYSIGLAALACIAATIAYELSRKKNGR